MPKQNGSPRDRQLRARIAQEAARLMVDDGMRDFGQAKRKAALRYGVNQGSMPSNQEIEQALVERQRLFRAGTQPVRLKQLRETALDAMRLLERFRPRLVGPVLAGTADVHSPVNLHLFADTAEELAHFLSDRGIPFDLDERQLRTDPDHTRRYPLFRFMAGDVQVELTMFPPSGLHHAPLSPVNGRPMARADMAAVRGLLDSGSELE